MGIMRLDPTFNPQQVPIPGIDPSGFQDSLKALIEQTNLTGKEAGSRAAGATFADRAVGKITDKEVMARLASAGNTEEFLKNALLDAHRRYYTSQAGNSGSDIAAQKLQIDQERYAKKAQVESGIAQLNTVLPSIMQQNPGMSPNQLIDALKDKVPPEVLSGSMLFKLAEGRLGAEQSTIGKGEGEYGPNAMFPVVGANGQGSTIGAGMAHDLVTQPNGQQIPREFLKGRAKTEQDYMELAAPSPILSKAMGLNMKEPPWWHLGLSSATPGARFVGYDKNSDPGHKAIFNAYKTLIDRTGDPNVANKVLEELIKPYATPEWNMFRSTPAYHEDILKGVSAYITELDKAALKGKSSNTGGQ